MAEIQIKDLCKNFGKVKATIDLNLDIKDKEMVCFLGPSGCGKTTSLRMVAGLERPSSGTIHIGGKDVTNLSPRDRDIAMVFENYALYPQMTVFENIGFPLKVREESKEEIKAKVMKAAGILEIEELLDRNINQLSGGQKQRVAMGRAIVRDPAVFLMDEPISHLDAKLRAHMRGEIKRLQKDLGTTMIYVTHDQLEAMSMADRIAVMRFGVLQQFGTSHEVFNEPANEFVAGFVGDPPMNFMDGSLVQEGGRSYIKGDGFSFEIPDEKSSIIKKEVSSGSIRLGIRPSHFEVLREKTEQRCFPVEVYVSEPLGEIQIIDFIFGGEKIKVVTNPDEKLAIGEKAWLKFDWDKALIFDAETGSRIG